MILSITGRTPNSRFLNSPWVYFIDLVKYIRYITFPAIASRVIRQILEDLSEDHRLAIQLLGTRPLLSLFSGLTFPVDKSKRTASTLRYLTA